MGVVSLLVQVALDASTLADPSAMACGFPSASADEPGIRIEIAHNEDIYSYPGYVGVMMLLNSGARVSGRAQSVPTGGQRGLMIAGSPVNQVYYTISMQPDGRAALNIRDLRDHAIAREVTRPGTCRAHENILKLVLTY